MHIDEALASHLLTKEHPANWRWPKLSSYNGKSDLEDHLHNLIIGMEDIIDRDDISCRMFRRTLKEEAIGWYQKLPRGSVRSFANLKSSFCQAYNHQARRRGKNATLLNIKQGPNETLQVYIKKACKNSPIGWQLIRRSGNSRTTVRVESK